MAATGARISELLQIKMEHVQAGFIDLCTKGGKIRRIYIPKKLAIAALEWLQDQKIESGFIFLNHWGRLISREGIATR
jgi:integrase